MQKGINYTQKPKVYLLNHTENLLELWCMIRRVMHAEIPNSVKQLKQNPKKWLGMSINKYIDEVLLKDGMPTFQEYGNFTFKLENVSRNLTHQLVRHRVGFSYSQQSMRCVPAKEFASKGLYHMPETVINKRTYHTQMLLIQAIYNDALKNGCSIQDARGLLPTNIYTTITFSCTPRAFFGMINKRLCSKTQGEFREVANQMADLVYKNVDKRLSKWIGAPCDVSGYCIMKGENEEQYKKGLIFGKQNTDHICHKYLNKFKGERKVIK